MSYLNTVPLVWGMLHGPQRSQVQLSFSIPSVCAAELERGEIELGLVPVAEIARQGLEIIPGVGITCVGAVRSILLFSKVPWREVRTLAAALSSRTSEWWKLTELPMVFAAWAGKPGLPGQRLSELTTGSYRFGRERLDEIVEAEYMRRGVTRGLGKQYLSHYIRYELGCRELEGLDTFFRLAGLVHDYSTKGA